MTLPFVLCIQHWPPNSSKCFGCKHSCLRAFAHTHNGLHFSQHIHRNINREAECGIHGKRKVNGLNKSSTLSMEKKAQPTPIFLSGKSHGQRSMVGYSPRGHKSWTQFSDFTTTTRCPTVPGTGPAQSCRDKKQRLLIHWGGNWGPGKKQNVLEDKSVGVENLQKNEEAMRPEVSSKSWGML